MAREPAAFRTSLRSLALLALLAGSHEPPAVRAEEPQARPPLDLDLRERAGRRLVQLDVTVRGPAQSIAGLTAQDFELKVAGRTIEDILVDRICEGSGAQVKATGKVPAGAGAVQEAPPPAPSAPPTSYLFYFDQAHLTMAGRQRSLDLAKELIERLISPPHRAMIVSSAQEVRTFAELTTEPAALVTAIDQLEHDGKQWDSYAFGEEDRVGQILRVLDEGGMDAARLLASRHQREEIWHTEKALRRFAMVLGRFADVDPPKVVIYFADSMRTRPGEHYLYLLPRGVVHLDPNFSLGPFAAASVYDKVINEAAAHGLRLYTVQAEGLVATLPPSYSFFNTRYARGSRPMPWAKRLADAQDSLTGFALETGGKAFLNGVGPDKIARQIQADLSCFYLLSFDASQVPEEQQLRVHLRVNRPDVTVQTRGRLFVQSESSRLTSRLLAAFVTPERLRSDSKLTATVIPSAFHDGEYSALVQMAVPPSPLSGAVWDLGVSLVSRGQVAEDDSGRVSVSGPGVPVVFEAEMRFAPRPYELVLVAHENTGRGVVSGLVEATLPDPRDAAAVIAAITVVQPSPRAVFLREGETRTSGSLTCGDPCRALTDRLTAWIVLVCRGHLDGRREAWRAVRRLVGETATEFPPVVLDFGEDRCVQIRDVVPAGTMTSGKFVYEVGVWDEEREIASASHELHAVDP